jgi:hypothetical protein
MNTRYLGLSVLALSLATPGFVKANALTQPPQPAYSQDHDRDRWDMAPAEYREVQRRGWQDGIEAARKDYDNHRKPDVDNREEYRHPHLAEDQRDAYREGFRRGYERGVEHLWGVHDHDIH